MAAEVRGEKTTPKNENSRLGGSKPRRTRKSDRSRRRAIGVARALRCRFGHLAVVVRIAAAVCSFFLFNVAVVQ